MTASKKDKPGQPQRAGGKSELNQPDWSEGLKRLYDSVVDEPLPDSFMELLSRLDDDEK